MTVVWLNGILVHLVYDLLLGFKYTGYVFYDNCCHLAISWQLHLCKLKLKVLNVSCFSKPTWQVLIRVLWVQRWNLDILLAVILRDGVLLFNFLLLYFYLEVKFNALLILLVELKKDVYKRKFFVFSAEMDFSTFGYHKRAINLFF